MDLTIFSASEVVALIIIRHKGEGRARTHDLYENDTLVYPEGYLTDLFSQKAVAFIKQKHNKPFFLTITYNAPHWPWQGPNDKPYPDSVDFRNGGSPAIYAAMMKSLDDGVGSIMKALDDEQLANQRNKQKAIRDGDWKYLQDENGEYLFNVDVDQG